MNVEGSPTIAHIGSIRIEEGIDGYISVWWPDWVFTWANGSFVHLGCSYGPHVMIGPTETITPRESLAQIRVADFTIDDLVRISGNRDAWVRHQPTGPDEDSKL